MSPSNTPVDYNLALQDRYMSVNTRYWILAHAIAYKPVPIPLDVHDDKITIEWNALLSFEEISIKDLGLKQAQSQNGLTGLEGDIYKIELCKFSNFDPDLTGDFKKARVDIQKRIRRGVKIRQ